MSCLLREKDGDSNRFMDDWPATCKNATEERDGEKTLLDILTVSKYDLLCLLSDRSPLLTYRLAADSCKMGSAVIALGFLVRTATTGEHSLPRELALSLLRRGSLERRLWSEGV